MRRRTFLASFAAMLWVPRAALALRDPLAPLAGPGRAADGPAALAAQIRRIAQAMPGSAGVAVRSVEDDWAIDWNGGRLYPQQSCSKLWVAITALKAVDAGRLRLTDRVTLGREDLTLFHQPLRELVLGTGQYRTTLSDLMTRALTESDNTANDRLMRQVGGPKAVRAMIAREKLGAIRFFDGERALQSKVAGLVWRQAMSIGDAFTKARAALPMALRRASFERYIADPDDGAAPMAVAQALARLSRGDMLAPGSTRLLLDTMGETKTGRLRGKAGLSPGWRWLHKTGTGQDFDGRVGGLNDIGLLVSPAGRRYAVAMMSVPASTDGAAQDMMRDVVRAVIAFDAARAR